MLNGDSSYVYSLAVLQDGSLASGSGDKTIRIWDTKADQSTNHKRSRGQQPRTKYNF